MREAATLEGVCHCDRGRLSRSVMMNDSECPQGALDKCTSGAKFGMHSAGVWKSGLSKTVRDVISSGDLVCAEERERELGRRKK